MRRLDARAIAGAVVVIAMALLALVAGNSRAVWVGTTSDGGSDVAAGDWYRFTSVASGREFGCTSNTNDHVWCWGRNNAGQLGDGTGSDSSTPVRVVGAGGSGYLTGITEVVAGMEFACGLEDDDTVWCWGKGDKGQLGNGATADSDHPVQVVGVGGTGVLGDIVDLAAGEKHTCAVASTGYAFCWGENNDGQLGDNTGSNSATPVQVTGVGGTGSLTGLTAVGSGKDHACAVGPGGAVYCWGRGDKGQRGDGTTSSSDHPEQVVGVGGSGTLSAIAEVDGGDAHTCARASSGSMYCWGENSDDQLAPGLDGDATVVWRDSGDNKPQQAVYTSGSGLATTVAMADVGKWRVVQGAASPDGSEAIVVGVDDGDEIDAQIWTGGTWAEVPFNKMADVSDSFWWGFDVAYESQSGDAVLVWNNGSTGSASISYRTWNGSSWSGESTITTPIAEEAKQMQLAASPDSDEMVLVVSNGLGHDYALVWNGSTWGNSIVLSTTDDDLTEVNVAYEQQSGDAIVIHGKHSDEMYYRIWNGSWSGESTITVPSGISTSTHSRWSTIGSDPNSDRIVIGVQNDSKEAWVAVWDGSAWGNKLAVTSDGRDTVYPWLAVAFEGASGHALATYGESSRYVRYRTWTGSSWSGEYSGPDMGTGEYVNSMVLYPRLGSDEIMFVGQDDDSDLELYPWNGSSWGSYMQPTTDTGETKNQPFVFLWDFVGAAGSPPGSSSSPLLVAGPGGSGVMSDVAHIGTGSITSCASLTGGEAYCWGRNDRGQVGDNSTTDRAVPTRVVGSGGTGWFGDAGLMSGGHSTGAFTCATRTDPAYSGNPARADESVWCWGKNDKGQLGDGTTTERHYPVQVTGI